jgi:RNA recognition motif-containing protein
MAARGETLVLLVAWATTLQVSLGFLIYTHMQMESANRPQDRRDGYPPREQLPLPTQPPYTAHIGNMSFDATQGDVSDFFRDCEVTSVRIVEDKLDHRPKGFGYVEFGSLEGLKKALSYNGNQLGGRAIRISVADPRKSEPTSTTFSACTKLTSLSL